ncbi:hypothetical protein GYMLUDRAFT_118987, partial [Collybiopsis luxurians FD-317 M1]
IQCEAVYKMYQFCKARGLHKVWGYMWACWYCPKMWKLWAHSSSPNILSHLCTTMGVENHWKIVKHDHLHHLSHPRLDYLIYILIHKVTPTYYAHIDHLNEEYRLGCPKSLTPFQMAFKSEWKKLAR